MLFVDFLRPGADERLYEEVKDGDKLVKLLNDYLEEYNEGHHNQVRWIWLVPAKFTVHLFRAFVASR